MQGVTRIANERVDSFGQSEFLIDFLEKEHPGIGGELAAGDIDVDFLFLVGWAVEEGDFVVHSVWSYVG